VAELADARDSKSRSFGNVGSIPTLGIKMASSDSGDAIFVAEVSNSWQE
jgi:hypothetical protein